MQPNDAIRAIATNAGLSLRTVSERIGKSPNHLSSALQNKDKQAGFVATVAAACGYVLALVPAGELPEGAITVDPPSREPGE